MKHLIVRARRRVPASVRWGVAIIAVCAAAAGWACAGSGSGSTGELGGDDSGAPNSVDFDDGPSTNVAPPVKQTNPAANEADEGAPPVPADAAPAPVVDAGHD